MAKMFTSPAYLYFVVSPSGKPVLVHRDGSVEEDASRFAGVAATARALLSFSQSKFRGPLRVFESAGRRFHFLEGPPLAFLAVTDRSMAAVVTKTRLALLYAQLVGLFTLPALHGIYAAQPGYDLRRLLAGSGDRMLGTLITGFGTRPCSFLGAVAVRVMGVERRQQVRKVLEGAVGMTGSAFGMVFDGAGRLVSFVSAISGTAGRFRRSMRTGLGAWDLILLENLCRAVGQAETVLSVCLPCFDSRGNFYAYVLQRDGCTTVMLSGTEIADVEVFRRVSSAVLDASCESYGDVTDGEGGDEEEGASMMYGYPRVNVIFKNSRTNQYVTNGACPPCTGGLQEVLRRYACMRAGMFAHDGVDAPVAEQLLDSLQNPNRGKAAKPCRPSHAFRVEYVGGMAYVAFASVDAELYVAMDVQRSISGGEMVSGDDASEDERQARAVEVATSLRAHLVRQSPRFFFECAV